jgi:hypothetical protein
MRRRATSQEEWARWRTQGFALGPFAYQNELERQLRKQMPLKDFAEQIHVQLVDTNHKLPPNLMSWLYDRSLRTRLEKETMELARKTLTTRSSQNGQSQMAKLLELLSVYPNFDLEWALRRAVGREKGSRTGRRAAELKQNLRDLSYQIRWWLGFTEWGTWQEHYRDCVAAMDKRLRIRIPAILKTKAQRAAVISAALEALGLKKKESTDAILRLLRRHNS